MSAACCVVSIAFNGMICTPVPCSSSPQNLGQHHGDLVWHHQCLIVADLGHYIDRLIARMMSEELANPS
jgi:hypothetical protein